MKIHKWDNNKTKQSNESSERTFTPLSPSSNQIHFLKKDLWKKKKSLLESFSFSPLFFFLSPSKDGDCYLSIFLGRSRRKIKYSRRSDLSRLEDQQSYLFSVLLTLFFFFSTNLVFFLFVFVCFVVSDAVV